ncbi:sensor histidine kinase [Sphingosinithalassobacter portus]|uniref:sensor histidine kinase n=1 Tax=Stakelama portus TaxID=2676234 RepID=UPI00137A935F|nr:ATP-binding protein [Sphingosinithalassobacter portus]
MTSQRLLIVHGDTSETRRIADMLHSNEVLSAQSLEDGCTLIREQQPAAVVLDLVVAECGGVACVREIREASKDVAIIALGAQSDDRLALECISAGAQTYLAHGELQQALLRRAVEYSIYRIREASAQRRADSLLEQLEHSQRLESLGLMSSGIAHDLNNTLQPILTVMPLLRARIADPDSDEALAMIHEAAIRSRGLVREIVDVGRSQATEPLHALALDQFIADVSKLLKAGLPPYIQLKLELEQVPLIDAYRNQLYQIVLNLVTNAAQAIGDSNGEIVISVNGDFASRVARLSVGDDGPGMDTKTLEKIFEPFFTTRHSSGGSGLGLSVVRKAVEKIGAEITVESSPGKGTRFELKFDARQGGA